MLTHFFAYRLPGETEVHTGASEGGIEPFRNHSFLIAPFLFPDEEAVAIPYADVPLETIDGLSDTESHIFVIEKDDYLAGIEAAKSTLISHEEKVVISRSAELEIRGLKASEVFSRLSDRYPDAFVFCFHTPEFGTWIGATPELLLSVSDGTLETMALAGTRSSSDNNDPWDDKNIVEQQIVTDYIAGILHESGMTPSLEGPFTKKAGPVEHICTRISAQISGYQIDIPALLGRLSPTPALCGYPKDRAMNTIAEIEKRPRLCYGGFCGPYNSDADFRLFVNLRSMLYTTSRIYLFVGGGITLDSDPQSEWTETERKAATLKTVVYNI